MPKVAKKAKATGNTKSLRKDPKEPKGYAPGVSPVMRCSFPSVHRPVSQGKFDVGKYVITCFLPKEDKAKLKPLKLAALKAGKEAWGEKTRLEDLLLPFKDGDDSDVECYKGSIYFKAKTGRKPQVVDSHLEPLEEGEEVYGGCFVKISVTANAYYRKIEKETETGIKTVKRKAVSFYLNNVQFVKDGERFGGGGSDPREDFDEVDPSEYEDMEEDEGFEEGETEEEEELDDDDDTEF